MSMFAPAACKVRAISAPTRRAPPVISTTWSRNEESILGFMHHNDIAMVRQRELMLNHAQAQHCARMREFLARQIAAAGGWLSFERFMDMALYAPGLGYYSAGSAKIGSAGDFVTAPDVSDLF